MAQIVSGSKTAAVPAFDLEAALEFVDGSMELLAKLGDRVKKESDLLMERLRQALAAGDRELVRRSAHSMKGMFSYTGAPAARDSAAAVEAAARSHDLTKAAELTELHARELERFFAAFAAHFPKPS